MSDRQIVARVILTRVQVQYAWRWLLRNLSPRPELDCGICVYDRKLWGVDNPLPLTLDLPTIRVMSHLYLTSQIGDRVELLEMANGGRAADLVAYTPTLEDDTRNVIVGTKRFRNALSEHLAFWVCLATFAKLNPAWAFACSQPHFQPEDKGPDGLVMAIDTSNSVSRLEVVSIKSSCENPKKHISSPAFRSSGTPYAGKLLDDFSRQAHDDFGFGRLERLLDHVSTFFRLSLPQSIRVALLMNCAYNATVVADDRHAASDLFVGYERVVDDVASRIATYVGSADWKSFAEATRKSVVTLLKKQGMM